MPLQENQGASEEIYCMGEWKYETYRIKLAYGAERHALRDAKERKERKEREEGGAKLVSSIDWTDRATHLLGDRYSLQFVNLI